MSEEQRKEFEAAVKNIKNAAFTWVSRARNTGSLKHHAIAAVFSNGIWLLVIRQVVLNFDNWTLMLTYLVAAVTGSLLMHYVSMNYFERKSSLKSPKG